MRPPIRVVMAVVAASLSAAVGSGFGAQSARAAPVPDCGSTTRSDSAYFIDFARRVATAPDFEAVRAFSQIPLSDSATFWANPTQCDTVSARYRAHVIAETGDSLWGTTPVLLVRIYPNRFLADPMMTDGQGAHILVTLDTSLHIVKVWKTQ